MGYFFALGFLYGLRHALDADHVAAVAALATRARSARQMLRLGLAWGGGHAVTLFAVCALVLGLDLGFTDEVAHGLELLVGVMLIALGLDVVRRVRRERMHAHAHRHGADTTHLHLHTHAGEAAHAESRHGHDHPATLPGRAAAIGLMHGLAGSAGLLLLSAGAMESVAVGLVYIALFGLGSMLGMAALSLTIALPLRYTARFATWGYNGIHAVIGVGTAALGAVVVARNAADTAAWLGLA
jgi:ABC-type nickel/cobalt efflux system permease component RcnA